ncbi:MAG TPA: hypothetical protein VGX23_13385 [Actinocrinis sp.]|nr:hypothetical protein [Actinocrinis sp.]
MECLLGVAVGVEDEVVPVVGVGGGQGLDVVEVFLDKADGFFDDGLLRPGE